jgi:hypothetical protein
MRTIALAAVLVAFAAPVPALAQDRTEEDAARVADTLRDPVLQESVAAGMAAASEALLDVPLAPLARAVAEAAGDDPRDVDPNMTLRSVSPEAEDVPAEIHDKLPRVMGAMAGMAGGVSAMIPALREMAARMEEAVERARPRY